MSTSIALLCEGAGDVPVICVLADRIIIDGVDWIPADDIDSYRRYRGFRLADRFMSWFEIEELAKQHNVKSRGHFNGLPLHRDGHNARKALELLTLHAPGDPVSAVIVFRDGDREYKARCDAILEVRNAAALSIPIVVGVANRVSAGSSTASIRQTKTNRFAWTPNARALDSTRAIAHTISPKRILARIVARNECFKR